MSKPSKPDPEQWYIVEYAHHRVICEYTTAGWITVGSVLNDDQNLPRTRANAHLMVSAPAMLKTLKRVRAHLDALGDPMVAELNETIRIAEGQPPEYPIPSPVWEAGVP